MAARTDGSAPLPAVSAFRGGRRERRTGSGLIKAAVCGVPVHFPRGLHYSTPPPDGLRKGRRAAQAVEAPRASFGTCRFLGTLACSALHWRGPLTASVRVHPILVRHRHEKCAAGVSGLVGGCFFRNLVFGTAPSADTRERRAGLPSSMSCVGGDSRSASLPTRLETRTKESNLCASRGARLRSPLPRRSESERSSIPVPQPARSLPSAPRHNDARSGAQRGPAPAA